MALPSYNDPGFFFHSEEIPHGDSPIRVREELKNDLAKLPIRVELEMRHGSPSGLMKFYVTKDHNDAEIAILRRVLQKMVQDNVNARRGPNDSAHVATSTANARGGSVNRGRNTPPVARLAHSMNTTVKEASDSWQQKQRALPPVLIGGVANGMVCGQYIGFRIKG